MTKGGGVGMTQASMQKVHTSGEGNRSGGGGGGGGVNRVELVGAVTSVKEICPRGNNKVVILYFLIS